MRLEVYHANEPNFGFDNLLPAPVWPDGFTKVAELELPSDEPHMLLETAYQLTNTIDSPWYQNAGFPFMSHAAKARSTSVGDMIVMDGKRFICASCGWNEVSPEDACV